MFVEPFVSTLSSLFAAVVMVIVPRVEGETRLHFNGSSEQAYCDGLGNLATYLVHTPGHTCNVVRDLRMRFG